MTRKWVTHENINTLGVVVAILFSLVPSVERRSEVFVSANSSQHETSVVIDNSKYVLTTKTSGYIEVTNSTPVPARVSVEVLFPGACPLGRYDNHMKYTAPLYGDVKFEKENGIPILPFGTHLSLEPGNERFFGSTPGIDVTAEEIVEGHLPPLSVQKFPFKATILSGADIDVFVCFIVKAETMDNQRSGSLVFRVRHISNPFYGESQEQIFKEISQKEIQFLAERPELLEKIQRTNGKSGYRGYMTYPSGTKFEVIEAERCVSIGFEICI